MFTSGPFTVFRNAPHVNTLWNTSAVLSVLRCPHHCGFDEWVGPRGKAPRRSL